MANGLPWVDVRKYENGQSLDKTTLNIPIEDLTSRTDYLKRLLDGLDNPFSSVIIHDLTFDPGEVSIGDVVYIDTEDTRYNIHLAKSDVDAMDELASYKTAFAIGIVTAIPGQPITDENETATQGTTCSVTIYGQVNNISISAITDDGSDTPGVYYLSGREAGKITRYPSGPQILLGTFLSDRAFLTPNHKSFAESHIHRSVKLLPNILTSEEAEDDNTEGWVAFSASKVTPVMPVQFGLNGGYKYKASEGSILNKFFPPIPKACASMVINGVELQSMNIDPDGGVYWIGDDTIYVLHDWFDTSTQTGELDKITFHFIRGIQGNQGPVTSLRPKPGSPIIVTACNTDIPDTVGDLDIDIKLDIQDEQADEPGFFVYKRYDTKDKRFKKGPVVEKIIAGNKIKITPANPEYPGQGVATIDVDDGSVGGEFDTTALQNAKQEMLGLFPYIKLPVYVESVPYAFVVKFQVPVELTNNEYNIIFYASMFGCGNIMSSSSSYTSVPIGFTASILPDLYDTGEEGDTSHTNNLKTGLITIPEKVVEIPLYGGYQAYDPVLLTNDSKFEEVHNQVVKNLDLFKDPITEQLVKVRPGYIVAVRISRAEDIGYIYPLGFINLRWGLSPVVNHESQSESQE